MYIVYVRFLTVCRVFLFCFVFLFFKEKVHEDAWYVFHGLNKCEFKERKKQDREHLARTGYVAGIQLRHAVQGNSAQQDIKLPGKISKAFNKPLNVLFHVLVRAPLMLRCVTDE